MSSTAQLVPLATIVPPLNHEVGGGFNATVSGSDLANGSRDCCASCWAGGLRAIGVRLVHEPHEVRRIARKRQLEAFAQLRQPG